MTIPKQTSRQIAQQKPRGVVHIGTMGTSTTRPTSADPGMDGLDDVEAKEG